MSSKKFDMGNLTSASPLDSDIFGEPNIFAIEKDLKTREKTKEIATSLLQPSPKNPYNVDPESDEMTQLVASIRESGILTPILVRPLKGERGYEIISGHRRKCAADIIGLEKVPVLIKELSDEEADRIMVDMNLNRENVRPSEKARAIKLKYDAIKRTQGRHKRNDVTQAGHDSAKIIAEQMGMSDRTIQEYIRLTHLCEYCMDAVDANTIPRKAATQLSYLPPTLQKDAVLLLSQNGVKVNESVAKEVRGVYEEKKGDTKQTLKEIESRYGAKPEKRKNISVRLPSRIRKKYFPKGMDDHDIELVLLQVLNDWAAENNPEYKK